MRAGHYSLEIERLQFGHGWAEGKDPAQHMMVESSLLRRFNNHYRTEDHVHPLNTNNSALEVQSALESVSHAVEGMERSVFLALDLHVFCVCRFAFRDWISTLGL